MPDDAPERSDYSDTERAIFDAALKVFARKGRDGARMQAIADEADINKAMLHYYFRSKDRLYEDVLGYTVRRFMASFGAAVRDASTFAETLRAFIDGYVDFHRANQDAMRLVVNENMAGGSLLGTHLQKAWSNGDVPPKVFVEKIEAAIASGEIRDVDPMHTVVTVISSCLFFFITAPTVRIMHDDARDDWNAFVEARKAHLFDLIYHGLACPASP